MPAIYTSLRRAVGPIKKTETIQWASQQQRDAFLWGPTPLCYSGGFGAGKTALMALKFVWYADTFPGVRIAVARKTWEDFKKTTLRTFLKFIHPSMYSRGRRSDVDKSLILNNGSEFMWMHLDDPDTENIIKGLEINAFGIDQAEEVEEEIFERMMMRVGRWDQAQVPEWILGDDWQFWYPDGRPQPPPFVVLSCNPDHELHWLYRRFHEASEEHWDRKIQTLDGRMVSYHELGYKMIHSSSLDNKFLSDQNRQELMNRDESFVRRYVRGEWGMPEGKIHFIRPESRLQWTPELAEYIRTKCVLIRALDHGDTAPTCVGTAAIDPAGNMIVFREYYQPNKLVSDHRVALAHYAKGERYMRQVADPSIFNPTMQKHGRRWSVAEEYADSTRTVGMERHTAVFWEKGDNDELGTRNRINEMLKLDVNRVNPFTGEKGSPRLFFVMKSTEYQNGCHKIVAETEAQRREKIGTELGRPVFSDDRQDGIPDHGYDVLRYLVASRPESGPTTRTSISSKSFKAVQARMKRETRLRRHALRALRRR